MNSGRVKIEISVWERIFRLLRAYSFVCFSLFTIHYSLLPAASAQDDPRDQAPPPVTVISKEELTRLATKTDIEGRTKLSIELMNARLLAAEKRGAAEDFDGVFSEFGVFIALMDDAFLFLKKRNNGGGKVLDNFKRIEINLRAMTPRIEVVRRELPPRYDDFVRKLSAYVREARAKATETLLGDTVIQVKKPPQ